MSAPLVLKSSDLRDIGYALEDFTKIRREHGIELGAYGMPEIRHIASDSVLRLGWSDDHGYYIDDRNGD
jgi:hypothetical protein